MPNQKKKSAEQKNSNKNTIEVNNKTQEEVKEAEENNIKEKKSKSQVLLNKSKNMR